MPGNPSIGLELFREACLAEEEELAAQLARLPDLGQALREAPAAVKRQVFESFELRIAYDRAERRVELTATVSEAVADAFGNAEALLVEGSGVVVRYDSGGPIRLSLPPTDRRASRPRGLPAGYRFSSL